MANSYEYHGYLYFIFVSKVAGAYVQKCVSFCDIKKQGCQLSIFVQYIVNGFVTPINVTILSNYLTCS